MACWDYKQLGLTPEDTDAVMRGMFDTAPAVPPKPDAMTPQARPVTPAQPTVTTREAAPPMVRPPAGQAVPPSGKAAVAPEKPKSIWGTVLATAGAGFLVGGPPGALVGAVVGVGLAPKKK